MKRRDFLVLRMEQAIRVIELSCERLYMHYQQADVALRDPAPDACELPEEELPALFVKRNTQELFDGLDRELREADVLRVVDTEWLGVDAFRQDVEVLFAAFRRRGGRVEYHRSC